MKSMTGVGFAFIPLNVSLALIAMISDFMKALDGVDAVHGYLCGTHCPATRYDSKIKIELEDLSLKYLEPEAYYDLVEKIALKKSARDDYIQKLVEEVRVIETENTYLRENAGIEAEIDGRAKHFFSIYKKMVNQDKTLDQIYDLFAIRIIVKDVKDSYAALGVIHEMYKPIPGRFKDYIAMTS